MNLRALASLAVCLAFLAACGDDAPEETTQPTPAAIAEPALPAAIAPAVAPVPAEPVPTPSPPVDPPARAVVAAAATPTPAVDPPAPVADAAAIAPPAVAATADPAMLARITAGDVAAGATIAARCSACHTFGAGEAALIGPNLYGIVGDPVGRSEGFAYSLTFRRMAGEGQNWTYGRLDAFIENPQAATPGTRMGFTGIADDDDRANLIAYLRTLDTEPAPIPTRVGAIVPSLAPIYFARAQASNGWDPYNAQCARCHGLELVGREGAGPPLTRMGLDAPWAAGAVYDLYNYIRSRMPADAPGTISNDIVVVIMAYILEMNGFTGGDAYLRPGLETMRRLGFYQY